MIDKETTARRKEIQAANYKIFERMANSLVKRKFENNKSQKSQFNNVKFSIEYTNKKNVPCIKINRYELTMWMFFGYKLEVFIFLNTNRISGKVRYIYFDADNNTLPNDPDEYITFTRNWLTEFIKTSYYVYIAFEHSHYSDDLAAQYLKTCTAPPPICNTFNTLEDMYAYRFDYNKDNQLLKDTLECLKSKQFKRKIGRNK